MFFALYLVLFFAFTPRFITIASLALFCVPLSVLIVFLLRFTRQQRENARLVDDMRQAAEIQQVLIPEHLPPTPNLTIHTEYRPAREVGGDFFQIIPHPSDGSDLANSVLVVAGDVTGKGLQAGMLVSLLVGAIRTAADVSSDPLLILQTLNRRLLGRGHAQATALALLIAPDGHATLANAGHIPPYLNGQPLDMEGALPLGMIPDADFSVMHFHLAPNDNLVLISDGILEATDPHGQLFGFDRVQQLLRDNLSPSALADAAQLFGQEDDISLISLTRNPHPS
jgi:serine phosphatase RsbU (regulator of sigma subunit)